MQKTSQKLVGAIKTLNKIEPSKIPIILTRVFEQDTANINILLSETEKEKFCKVFSIDEIELTNLINALYFIIIQAAFERNFKVVESQLLNAGINQPQLQALQDAWVDNAGEYVNKVKDKPIAIGKILDEIKWSLSVPFKESRLPVRERYALQTNEEKFKFDSLENIYPEDARNPFVIMTIGLQNIQNISERQSQKEEFVLKMNKGDVETIFEQLEIIQEHIDKLF